MSGNVLITGCNRGTGYAIAKVFNEQGYRVLGLNRTLAHEEWLEEIACDLSDPLQIQAASQRAGARLRTIDICVMNAAIRRFAPLEKMSDQDWEESLAVNLSANFRLARYCIPFLRTSGGTFVLIGSNASTHFFEEGGAYCVSKAALKAFAEMLFLETQPQGIRTLLITPGAIKNRPKEHDEYKIQPETVGKIIYDLVQHKQDAAIAEVIIQPAYARPSPLVGIERLQYH